MQVLAFLNSFVIDRILIFKKVCNLLLTECQVVSVPPSVSGSPAHCLGLKQRFLVLKV
jgi:hypothetical protein